MEKVNYGHNHGALMVLGTAFVYGLTLELCKPHRRVLHAAHLSSAPQIKLTDPRPMDLREP
jgi:hypothetical protein